MTLEPRLDKNIDNLNWRTLKSDGEKSMRTNTGPKLVKVRSGGGGEN